MVKTLKTQLNYQDGDLSGANEMNQKGLRLWSQRDSLMLTSPLLYLHDLYGVIRFSDYDFLIWKRRIKHSL